MNHNYRNPSQVPQIGFLASKSDFFPKIGFLEITAPNPIFLKNRIFLRESRMIWPNCFRSINIIRSTRRTLYEKPRGSSELKLGEVGLSGKQVKQLTIEELKALTPVKQKLKESEEQLFDYQNSMAKGGVQTKVWTPIIIKGVFIMLKFSFEDIHKSLLNIKKSGSQYLLTTTFTECQSNKKIVTGDWRIINLQKPPFNFPKPLEIINEGCSEGEGTYDDKSLGLWCIEELDI
jgi:hypothetical protein